MNWQFWGQIMKRNTRAVSAARSRFPRFFVAAAMSAGALSSAPILAAQDDVLEEIMVTATKRETNLQDTPIAIATFDMDQMDDANVRNVEDLSSIVPGLNVGTVSGRVLVSLRGIGNDNIFGGDPTVAFHNDGVFLGDSVSGNIIFHDLERVEVLKGPQGTLYGRNATGGSINVITAKPGDEFGGYIDATYGNYDRVGARGAVNLPVIDGTLSTRLSFLRETRDGYFNNAPSKPQGDRDDLAVRLHALYTPSDRVSFLLSFDHQTRGGVGDGLKTLGGVDADIRDAKIGPYTQPMNTTPKREDRFQQVSGELNVDLDFATLTYIGAYQKSHNYLMFDFDQGVLRDDILVSRFDGEQQTHELRLASSGESNWDWLVGGFFYDSNGEGFTTLDIPIRLSPSFVVTGVSESITPDANDRSWAFFSQSTYHLTPSLRLTAGLRYSNDFQSDINSYGRFTIDFLEVDDITLSSFDADWSRWDWKAGLEWDWNDDNLLYFNAGTGFKSGGFNDPLSTAKPEYDPEQIFAIQFGHKSQFFGGRLQLNTEVFIYDYKDLQVSQIETDASGSNNVVRNAAKADIKGFDTDLIARLTDNTRLDLAVEYIDTEFGGGFRSLDQITGNVVLLDGERMARAPQWSTQIGLEHTFHFGGGYTLTPRISTSYETKTKLRVFNDRGSTQPAYNRSDVSITLDEPSQRWSVQGFVSNLEDNVAWNNVTVFANQNRVLYPKPPRMYGIRGTYRFGAF
jgi:iron complex outermembrane recepter protein